MDRSANNPPGEGCEESEPPEPAERLVRRFEEALQEPDESLETFMARLREMAAIAFSDEAHRTRQRRVLWRFVAGLWDHDLSERLKEHNWLFHKPSGRQVTCHQLVGLARVVREKRPSQGFIIGWSEAAYERYRASVGTHRARVRLGQAGPLSPVPGEAPEGPGLAKPPGARQQRDVVGPTPRPPLYRPTHPAELQPSVVQTWRGGSCTTRPGLAQPFPAGSLNSRLLEWLAQPTPERPVRWRQSGPSGAYEVNLASNNPEQTRRSLRSDRETLAPVPYSLTHQRPAVPGTAAPAAPDAAPPSQQQRDADSPHYETITVVGTSSVSLPVAADDDVERDAGVPGAAHASNPGRSTTVTGSEQPPQDITQQQPEDLTQQQPQDLTQQQQQDLTQQQQQALDPAREQMHPQDLTLQQPQDIAQRRQQQKSQRPAQGQTRGPVQHQPQGLSQTRDLAQQTMSSSMAGGEPMHLDLSGPSASLLPVQAQGDISGRHGTTPDLGSSATAAQVHGHRQRRSLRIREAQARTQDGSRSATNGGQSPPVRSRSPITRHDSLRVHGPSPDFQNQQLLAYDSRAPPDPLLDASCPAPMDSSLTPEKPSQSDGSRFSAEARGPAPKHSVPHSLPRNSTSLSHRSWPLPQNLGQSPTLREPASVSRSHDPTPMDLSPPRAAGSGMTAVRPEPPRRTRALRKSAPPALPRDSSQDRSLVRAPIPQHSPALPPAPVRQAQHQSPASQGGSDPVPTQPPGSQGGSGPVLTQPSGSQGGPGPAPHSETQTPSLFSQYSSLSSVGQAVGLPPLLRFPFSQFTGADVLSVDPTLVARFPSPLSPLSPVSQGVMPRLPPASSPLCPRPSPLAGPPVPHSVPPSSGQSPHRPSPLVQNPGPSPRRDLSGQALIPQDLSTAPQGQASSQDPPSSAQPLRSHSQHPQGGSARPPSPKGAIPRPPSPKGAIPRPPSPKGAIPRAPIPQLSADSEHETLDRTRRRRTRAERNGRRERRLARTDKLRRISGNGTRQDGGAAAAVADTDAWNDYRREKDSD